MAAALQSGMISSMLNVVLKVSDNEQPAPYLDLDVLFFDSDTGSFVTHADADDDIAFH